MAKDKLNSIVPKDLRIQTLAIPPISEPRTLRTDRLGLIHISQGHGEALRLETPVETTATTATEKGRRIVGQNACGDDSYYNNQTECLENLMRIW